MSTLVLVAAVPGGGGGSLLTTMTLVNTSGSTQAANFVTPMFGHPFKKGDIASSSFPKFETTGGTNIPYTSWGKVAWPDGSWKFAGFMLRVPSSIAGSGTLTVNVKNGGSAQAASARATSDLSAQDLKVVLTGIDNLTSGPWTSQLNQGITDADDLLVIGDGQAGKVWRIRQQFMSGGAGTEHGQLECYWHVAALQNSSNGLYGIRVMPRGTQPWCDVASPTPQKSGFTAAFQNGASTTGLTQPVAFATNAYTINNGNPLITMTGAAYQIGTPIRLGTAVSPFTTSTTYYTRPNGTNTFQLHPTASDSLNNFNAITPAATGSGTATPHIEIVQFGSFFAPNADGSWQYLQGGGSVAAESTVRIQFNKTYWRSTKMVPPYDLTVSPTASATISYDPQGAGQLERNMGNTGERDDIGVQPSWVARHFMTQGASDERAVRINGLAIAGASINVRRSSTKCPIVGNNGPDNAGGTYTGMGASVPTLEWNASNLINAMPVTPSGDLLGGWLTNGFSHWPSTSYYPYLITGEPQYLDLMQEIGNYAVICRWTAVRNFTVSAHDYYGCCFQDDSQARTDAWGSRELALAAAISPTTAADGSAIKTYLTDMMTAGYQMMIAYNALQSSFWTTNGIYFFRNDSGSAGLNNPWQLSYLLNSVAMAYAVTESSDAGTFLNYLTKFPVAADADVGIYHYTGYQNRMRTGNASGDPLITNINQMYWHPSGSSGFGWDASTDRVTMTESSTRFTLTDGDKLCWVYGPPIPGGLTAMVEYFARDVTTGTASTKTCKVAATLGGTAIDLTDSGGDSDLGLRMQVIPSSPNATGLDYQSPAGYVANAYGAFRFAEAAGASPMGSIRTKMDSYWADLITAGASFTADPKNALAASF